MTAFRSPENPPNLPINLTLQSIGIWLTDLVRWTANLVAIVRQILIGKLNATADLTLTANSATTTFTDARLSINSVVLFDPMTANAATELYGATMYVLTANRGNGVWTITNANNANADRTFKVLIIG